MTYLDNAATTRVCPEAAAKAAEIMTEHFGNPSSTHTLGRAAKAELDTARRELSKALGCETDELFFTSGGTESDNWALLSGAEYMKRRGKHIISSAVEHDAVRKSLDELEKRGFETTRLAPESDGSISPQAVKAALREDTILVSLMMVNNETGGVTDISAVSRVLRESGSTALLHTDAVQGFMKLPFSAKTLGADLISVSGHKIHAPKGVGALRVRKGLRLPPLILGGGQEGGYRSGTEAMPAICAFGAAAKAAAGRFTEYTAEMARLREYAVSRLQDSVPGIRFVPGGAPHILSLSMPGYRSEVLMSFLEAREVYVSRSSACKRGRRSHVLEAMGLPADVIDGTLRVSLSRFTTQEDIDALCLGLSEAKAALFPALGRR